MSRSILLTDASRATTPMVPAFDELVRAIGSESVAADLLGVTSRTPFGIIIRETRL